MEFRSRGINAAFVGEQQRLGRKKEGIGWKC